MALLNCARSGLSKGLCVLVFLAASVGGGAQSWAQVVGTAPLAPVAGGDLVDALGSGPFATEEPGTGGFLPPPSAYRPEPTPGAATPRVTMSLLDTAIDSLTGDVYAPGKWRPLSLDTFFTEGWDESWAGGPAGQYGLTPRHGWLGAFDGVFYRLWLTTFTYQNQLNTPYRGNRYIGDYTIFLPLSRRFEVVLDAPFVVSNGTQTPGRGYTSQFGDFSVTPRVMLSETAALTQSISLGIRTPTGTSATGQGHMELLPRYEFWANPIGAWVVRGSVGTDSLLNQKGQAGVTALAGGLSVGRYFTPHDALFGDLVFYLNCDFRTPFSGASHNTFVGVGPGTRFHIANNWFFLGYWEVPVAAPVSNTYTAQFALMKVF